ncbi:MAG: trypsin-like peptidase domain-containing protein [Nitrospira sp.]
MKRTSMAFVTIWVMNWLCVNSSFAISDIPDNNLAYPVLIQREVTKGGSGFYLMMVNQIFLVTAKHVLFKPTVNAETGAVHGEEIISPTPIKALSYGKGPEDSQINRFLLDLQTIQSNGNLKKHDERDVAIVRMGAVNADGNLELTAGIALQEKSNSGFIVTTPENLRTFKSVLISNEVYMFGFPLELGLVPVGQYDYSKPLLRKGIVAGKDVVTKTLMIDLPSYHGNSGGPVLEVESDGFQKRFKIIGVLTQFVPTLQKVEMNGASATLLNHSGYSIAEPIDVVLELIASFVNSEDPRVFP